MSLLMKKTCTLSVKQNASESLFGRKGLRHYISAGTEPTIGSSLNVESYTTKSKSGRKYTSTPYTTLAATLNQLARPRISAGDRNTLLVAKKKNFIDVIKGLHRERETTLDWQQIKDAPPPFTMGEKGPLEQKAEATRRHYRPTLMDKLFAKIDQRERELDAAIKQAAKEDIIDYRIWENTVTLADGVLALDEDCWLMVLENMHSFDDLLEFGVSITAGANKEKCVEVEVHANTANVVPHQMYMLTQSGKLNRMDTDKASLYNLIRDYICSLTLRVVSDIFATLPADGVIINVVDDRIDSETEAISEITVLSAAMDRESIERLNFNVLNPWRTLSDMYCAMDFKKTEAPGEVKRVVG